VISKAIVITTVSNINSIISKQLKGMMEFADTVFLQNIQHKIISTQKFHFEGEKRGKGGDA